jgi:hypothetical protein
VPDAIKRLIPNGISITAVISVVAAFVGIVTAWNHFENRATNNAMAIEALKVTVAAQRAELRDLERSFDQRISHTDALVDVMLKRFPKPAEEKQ